MDYQKVYNDLVSFRKSNPLERSETVYTEDHHIVPSCMNGSDDPENMVRLTAREHFIAHRLLSKIYPDNARLAYAILLMSRLHNKKIYAREYDRLKKLISKQRKGPEFRNKMSQHSKRLWKNPAHREMMSERTKERCATPDYGRKWLERSNKPEFIINRNEALRDWRNERKGRPWLMPNAQKTREVWSLAQLFWEHRPNNPNQTETFTIKGFCKVFNEGKNYQIFYDMDKLFKKSWIPNLDPNWLKEFGHIRY